MHPDAPTLEVTTHIDVGEPIYRLTCPWCAAPTEWAISWMAVYRELSDHFFSVHRAVQDALKDRWRARGARSPE